MALTGAHAPGATPLSEEDLSSRHDSSLCQWEWQTRADARAHDHDSTFRIETPEVGWKRPA
jgi:hypothetical protein